MYACDWQRENFVLSITSEQFSAIKALSGDSTNFNLHIVFTIKNIEPMLPIFRANFSFDAALPDDIDFDEDSYTFFDARLVYGTLVDIIEVQNSKRVQ